MNIKQFKLGVRCMRALLSVSSIHGRMSHCMSCECCYIQSLYVWCYLIVRTMRDWHPLSDQRRHYTAVCVSSHGGRVGGNCPPLNFGLPQNFLIFGKFTPKSPKFGTKNHPFGGNLGPKLEFWALISSMSEICSCLSENCNLLPLRTFYARLQELLSRVLAIAILSVCPSVCLSHEWIRQKRCRLGSSNLHHRLPQRF